MMFPYILYISTRNGSIATKGWLQPFTLGMCFAL